MKAAEAPLIARGPEADRLERAWELAYLDADAAAAIGQELIHAGGDWAAWGWLHVALAAVRSRKDEVCSQAHHNARQAFADRQHAQGLAWCDEIQAIALRRAGEFNASAALQQQIDARQDLRRNPIMLFVAHNSRAITQRLLGQVDAALRHFYAALEAAIETGWAGPHLAALSNLGSLNQELYNLDDACTISEQALQAAIQAGAENIRVHTTVNLILIYHAKGEPQRARAMVDTLSSERPSQLPLNLHNFAVYLALGHLSVGEVEAALSYLNYGPKPSVGDGDREAMWAWLKARCLLAQGQPQAARQLAEAVHSDRQQKGLADGPYVAMELNRVLSDTCEACGDTSAALRYLRQAHLRYEQLVGRSARARYIALDVSHQLGEAQRQRDQAVHSKNSAESDRAALTTLNEALRKQAAETEMLHAKLREQALRDPLTGLHNRRYLFETTPGLLELARRQGTQVCVVLLDLDHFKLLNDTYGHQAGDMVLQRFSQLLTHMLRRSDVVCRHGGEEFVAVMPDIDSDGAEAMLERLLQAFQTQRYELAQRRIPSGSFSAGIARFPRHGQTLEQLLSRADRALYAAKNHGRARIEQAPRTGFGSLL